MTSHINRLRGTFALLVVIGHAMAFALKGSTPDYWHSLVQPLAPFMGFIWVVGFIVLSGYCIASSCAKAKNLTPHGYVLLRFSRLFPMLWVCLGVTALAESAMATTGRAQVWTAGIGDRHALISNAAGLGAYRGTYGSLAPAYTLSFELVFYMLWAIAWFGSGRRPGRALLLGVATGGAAGVAIWNSPTLQRIPYAWLTLILYGCWLIGAALAFNLDRLTRLAAMAHLAPLRWVPVALVMILGKQFYGMPRLESTKACWVYYPVLAMAFAFVVICLAATGHRESSRFDRIFGDLSYPLYLVHGPILATVAYLVALHGRPPFIVYVLILTAPALIGAGVMLVTVERPIMWLRRRCRSGQPRMGMAPYPVHVATTPVTFRRDCIVVTAPDNTVRTVSLLFVPLPTFPTAQVRPPV